MCLDKLTLIQVEFPEHPFVLVVAQSRVLGRPPAIGKLIDRPQIAFAVRVVVLGEGVIGFDQLAHLRLVSLGQRPGTNGGNGGAGNAHRLAGQVIKTGNKRCLFARSGNIGAHCTRPRI